MTLHYDRLAGDAPAKDDRLQIAVVVPVLNEAGNIRPMIDALSDVLGHLCYEVIFVDDGSTDGTIALIDELAREHRQVRAIKRFNRKGLASAIIEGAMSSAADVIAVIDGDMQHDERQLAPMYALIAQDRADMVIGTRYADGGGADGLSAARLKGSLLVTQFINRLLRTRCSDPMSGFLAIRRDRLVELCPHLSAIGFKIVLDILVSGKGKLRVAEQPFQFRDRHSGDSKMSLKILTDLFVFFIDRTLGRILPIRFILFLMVGSVGLLVHLAVLRLMLGVTGGDFRIAQTVAVLIAIAFNFTLNNILTYASQRLRGWKMVKGLATFYIVCGTGAIANIGVGTLMFGQHAQWWVAGIAGATVGAVWKCGILVADVEGALTHGHGIGAALPPDRVGPGDRREYHRPRHDRPAHLVGRQSAYPCR